MERAEKGELTAKRLKSQETSPVADFLQQ